jgi:hypothetical protein
MMRSSHASVAGFAIGLGYGVVVGALLASLLLWWAP